MSRANLALFAFAALALACPKAGGGADAGGDGGPRASGGTTGTGGSSSGGGTSGGSGGTRGGAHAGPGCRYDLDCLSAGLRCSPDGGCTLPAAPCDPSQGSGNCTVQSSASYCLTDGISGTNNCYCAPLPDGGGLCYVQLPPCAPCSSGLDCGRPQDVDNPGACEPLGAGSYCLPLDQTGNCPSGFLPGFVDGGNVCVPSCGACPCSACTSDGDCPSFPNGVCFPNGACGPPCQSSADCKSGEVCHVLGKYLDPSAGLLYGGGKCGPPCTGGADCGRYQEDAGVPLVCDADAGDLCRPAGCLADTDCLAADNPDASVIGWCDIWGQNQCVGDACRLGLSPRTGTAFQDCYDGYACALPDGGSPGPLDGGPPVLGLCFRIPCNLAGGAHIACVAGQLCCGEGDAGASCGGAAVGDCYPEPEPPWCQACNPQNGSYFSPDCAGVNDGYPGAVACTSAPSVKGPTAWCGPACDPGEPWTCPAGWGCDRQPLYMTDCSACPTECLDAGQVQGQGSFECGCTAAADCPIWGQALYQGSDCSLCPQGDAGCVPAGSGSGVNCLCDPDAGGCPLFQFGGQSFPSACQVVQGGNACVAYVPMLCDTGVCIQGYNCTSTAYGCPDSG
ncbi:MAG: hypothetical protein ACYDCL_19070 [Myxococcales bacterium]